MITRAQKREISEAAYVAYRTFMWALFALIAVALVTGWHWPRPVILAVPHGVYGLPACPTEDHGLPGGCVFQGSEGDTFVIYTPGRA